MKRIVIGSIFLLSACGGGGVGGAVGDLPLEPVIDTEIDPGDIPEEPIEAPETLYDDVNVASFTMLLNDERSGAGVQAVSIDDRLSTASEAHATDMLENNYTSHTGLDGSTPGERALAAGYDWDFIAENIGRGQKTEAEIIQDWDESPPHQAAMEHERAEDFGIGRAGDVWVLMLGSER